MTRVEPAGCRAGSIGGSPMGEAVAAFYDATRKLESWNPDQMSQVFLRPGNQTLPSEAEPTGTCLPVRGGVSLALSARMIP
jgi:hypothetical protein